MLFSRFLALEGGVEGNQGGQEGSGGGGGAAGAKGVPGGGPGEGQGGQEGERVLFPRFFWRSGRVLPRADKGLGRLAAQRQEVLCGNGAPDTPRGVGGRHITRRHLFAMQSNNFHWY